MRQYTTPIAILAALFVGYFAANRTVPVQAQSGGTARLAAVANDLGSLESTGPYEVVPNWPKDLSTLPGKEKWTFGAGQGLSIIHISEPTRLLSISYAVFCL